MRHKKLKQRLIDFQHMSWVEQNPQNSERNGNERAKKKKKRSQKTEHQPKFQTLPKLINRTSSKTIDQIEKNQTRICTVHEKNQTSHPKTQLSKK